MILQKVFLKNDAIIVCTTIDIVIQYVHIESKENGSMPVYNDFGSITIDDDWMQNKKCNSF